MKTHLFTVEDVYVPGLDTTIVIYISHSHAYEMTWLYIDRRNKLDPSNLYTNDLRHGLKKDMF